MPDSILILFLLLVIYVIFILPITYVHLVLVKRSSHGQTIIPQVQRVFFIMVILTITKERSKNT